MGLRVTTGGLSDRGDGGSAAVRSSLGVPLLTGGAASSVEPAAAALEATERALPTSPARAETT